MGLEALDIGAITFSISVLVLYHVHLYTSVFFRQNSQAQVAKMIENSFFWAKKHQQKDDPASGTLAVQTLRNTILVAVFVGGSSITLGLSYSDAFDASNELNYQIRSIILSTLCICSFLCFVLVIRLSAQLGYLIGTLNIPHTYKMELANIRMKQLKKNKSAKVMNDRPHTIHPSCAFEKVDKVGEDLEANSANSSQENTDDAEELDQLAKAAQLSRCSNILIMNSLMFSMGFRFLFIALPFSFYAMGPLGLIISTFLMLMFLLFYDYGVSILADFDGSTNKLH